MRKSTCLAVALLANTLLYGCTALMASSPSPQGNWALREIQGPQALTLTDPAMTFTLTLGEDNRANGKVACNGWHGQALIESNQLQLKNAGSTRMRCVIKDEALRSLEKRYLSTLRTPSQFQIQENRLQLRFPNGEAWFFERQQP